MHIIEADFPLVNLTFKDSVGKVSLYTTYDGVSKEVAPEVLAAELRTILEIVETAWIK